tara:strand:- start:339 stop:476 length:138 start_codon:yes stop_codon:yes gene_type:complete
MFEAWLLIKNKTEIVKNLNPIRFKFAINDILEAWNVPKMNTSTLS